MLVRYLLAYSIGATTKSRRFSFIHVRTQSDQGAIAGPENTDHPGLADVAMNLTAKFGKLPGDKLGSTVLLEAKSGVWCRSCRQAVNSP